MNYHNKPDYLSPTLAAMPPHKLADGVLVMLADSGMPDDILWVFHKAEVIVTPQNEPLLEPDVRRDWIKASCEYKHKKPDVAAIVAAARARLTADAY